MRRFAIDTARSYQSRVTLTDQAADLEAEPAPSAADVAAVNAEQRAAWRAWASLPEASRAVLWHVVVERQTPAEIAPILGTSPNGVTLRARRAKERLRQAFLQQHLAATDNQECRETRRLLGPYLRDALSSRDRAAVDEHLAGCERCRAVLLEIDDVNNTLRAAIAPVILGGALAAGHYLSSTGSAGHAAAFGVSPIGSGGAPGGAGAKSGASPAGSQRFWPSRSKSVTLAVVAAAAVIAALLVILGVIRGAPNQSPHAAPNPSTAPSSQGAHGPITTGSGESSVASSTPDGTVASAPASRGAPPAGGAPPPGRAQRPAAGLPQGAVAPGGGTRPAAAGPAANAAPPAAQQSPVTSAAPAGAAPAAAAPPQPSPSPVTVREAVAVAIPDPAASVTLTVPTRWTIEAVDAAGIAVTGCTGLHTTTVHCLNLGVGRTLAVHVQGIRTASAMLHVTTVGLGGGVRDYPL
jgi:hypothetical protein